MHQNELLVKYDHAGGEGKSASDLCFVAGSEGYGDCFILDFLQALVKDLLCKNTKQLAWHMWTEMKNNMRIIIRLVLLWLYMEMFIILLCE